MMNTKNSSNPGYWIMDLADLLIWESLEYIKDDNMRFEEMKRQKSAYDKYWQDKQFRTGAPEITVPVDE